MTAKARAVTGRGRSAAPWPLERGQYAPQDVRGLVRAPVDEDVDGNDLVHAARQRVAAAEHPARPRAVPHRHHELGRGSGVVGLAQRDLHVAGDRAGDEQQVGVARRGHEVDAEALAVVHRAHEAGDLDLAAVARSRVDLSHGEGAAEEPPRPGVDPAQQVDHPLVARAERLGDDADLQHFREQLHRAVTMTLPEHGRQAPARGRRAITMARWGTGALTLILLLYAATLFVGASLL